MKWGLLILFLSSRLWAMTPVLNDYQDPQNTFTELRNVFDNAQDQSFTSVIQSTPNYQEMKDGQIFIYISTPTAPVIKLMLRLGATVYSSPDFNIIKVR